MRTTFLHHRNLMKDLVFHQIYLSQTMPHPSHQGFVWGQRNKLGVYQLDLGVMWLKRSLRILKKPMVVVGHPKGLGESCEQLFRSHKIPFFHTGQWSPGYLREHSTPLLVIYDIHQNREARFEGLQTKTPIVSFGLGSSDLTGVDYPVPLCFEGMGAHWYLQFWQAVLRSLK